MVRRIKLKKKNEKIIEDGSSVRTVMHPYRECYHGRKRKKQNIQRIDLI